MGRSGSACPSSTCSAGGPRQSTVTQEAASAAGAEEIAGAERCTYCGCVYRRGAGATQILGHLDNGILGQGWKPR
jgi:hypothetical protein